MKPIDETNNANEHNTVKNPKQRRQTNWLFTSVTKELNYIVGSTKQEKNCSWVVRAGLEPANSKVRHPNHLASLSLQYGHTFSDLHSLWTRTDIRLFSRNLSVFAGYELHSKIKILTIDWPWLFPQNLQAVHLSYSWYPSGLSDLDESVLGNNHDQQMGYIHCNFQFLYMIIWRKTWHN